MRISQSVSRLVFAVLYCFIFLLYFVSAQTLQPNIPPTNGIVYAMAQSGDTLYIGGTFTKVGLGNGLVIRNRIAAIKLSTGAILPFNPNVNSDVYALATLDRAVYAGGKFTQVNGATAIRNRIAAFDANSSIVLPLDVNANNIVRTLAISGNTVYMGGDFTKVNGTSTIRNRLASFHAITGNITSWNPNANNKVRTIAIKGEIAYAGGDFTKVNGITTIRNHLAAFNTNTGVVTPWNPNAYNTVNTLAITYSPTITMDVIYVGGSFNNIGAQTRHKIAAIRSSDGIPTSFNPDAGMSNPIMAIAEVFTIAVSGDKIYAGGFFETIGGQTRRGIAVLNVVDGLAIQSWNASIQPNQSSIVRAILRSSSPNFVYVGGEFTSILGSTGVTQKSLAGITPP